MAYKILFIDEEKSQHNLFLNYMDAAPNDMVIKCLFPESDINAMIARIDEEHPDAIVADYLLNDIKTDVNYNIGYNGTDLLTEYRIMRPNFPCFVLTSYDEDAVYDTDDVNLIYVKSILTKEDPEIKSKFYDKIYSQIQKYKTSIVDAQAELKSLLEKRAAGSISLQEEQRLIDLDDFLEKSLDSYHAIPKEMKELSNLKNIAILIDKVDDLLKKLN